jgi:hypothetical protein
MRSPEAYFDALYVVSELGDALNGVSRLELQRTAFLSCLLSIFDGKPSAEWKYPFANTGAGTPFSDQLNEAVDSLVRVARLDETSGRFRVAAHAMGFLATLSGLESFRSRRRYLGAACGSILAVPASTAAIGIDNEPSISSSRHRHASTMLLQGAAVTVLHDHFATLAQFFPPSGADFVSPAVLWLSYMADAPVSERNSQVTGVA